jgi:hypothetical protein
VPSDTQQHERLARTDRPVFPGSAPRRDTSDSPEARARVVGVVLTVATVLLQSLLHAVNAVFFGADVAVLDANEEGTPATWASSVAVFAAALGAGLLALLQPGARLLLAVLAAVLAFLSLDDVAAFHERLNRFGEAWTVYAVPLLALTFVLLWLVAGRLSRADRRLVHLGLAFLAFAVVMETLQRLWLDGYDEGTWVWELDTGVEEAAELAGWGLIATGLLAAVCSLVPSPGGRDPGRQGG